MRIVDRRRLTERPPMKKCASVPATSAIASTRRMGSAGRQNCSSSFFIAVCAILGGSGVRAAMRSFARERRLARPGLAA